MCYQNKFLAFHMLFSIYNAGKRAVNFHPGDEGLCPVCNSPPLPLNTIVFIWIYFKLDVKEPLVMLL